MLFENVYEQCKYEITDNTNKHIKINFYYLILKLSPVYT